MKRYLGCDIIYIVIPICHLSEIVYFVKMRNSKTYLTVLVLTILVLDNINEVHGGSFEPYKVLGVHRRAPIGDIRKAYKRLAKEWHPDKVSGEQEKKEAEVKFIEINRAYELLR